MLPTSPPGGLWGPLDPLIPSSPHPFPQHHVTPTRACKDTHRKAHTRARPCTPPRPLRSLTCPRMCPPPPFTHACPRRLRRRATGQQRTRLRTRTRQNTRVQGGGGRLPRERSPHPATPAPTPAPGPKVGRTAPCESLARLLARARLSPPPFAPPLPQPPLAQAGAVCTLAVRRPRTNSAPLVPSFCTRATPRGTPLVQEPRTDTAHCCVHPLHTHRAHARRRAAPPMGSTLHAHPRANALWAQMPPLPCTPCTPALPVCTPTPPHRTPCTAAPHFCFPLPHISPGAPLPFARPPVCTPPICTTPFAPPPPHLHTHALLRLTSAGGVGVRAGLQRARALPPPQPRIPAHAPPPKARARQLLRHVTGEARTWAGGGCCALGRGGAAVQCMGSVGAGGVL